MNTDTLHFALEALKRWDARVNQTAPGITKAIADIEEAMAHKPSREQMGGWIGLTKEEVHSAFNRALHNQRPDKLHLDMAAYLEAKLKEKNNG